MNYLGTIHKKCLWPQSNQNQKDLPHQKNLRILAMKQSGGPKYTEWDSSKWSMVIRGIPGMDLKSFSIRHPLFDLRTRRMSPAAFWVIPFSAHSSPLDAVLMLIHKETSPKVKLTLTLPDIIKENTEITPKNLWTRNHKGEAGKPQTWYDQTMYNNTCQIQIKNNQITHLTPPSFQKEGMSKGQSSAITKAWQVTAPERASEYVRKPKKEKWVKGWPVTKGKIVNTQRD